jgi:type II secretory pathway pseudopilin PulG
VAKPPDDDAQVFGTMQLPAGAHPSELPLVPAPITEPDTPQQPSRALTAAPAALTIRPAAGDSMTELPPPMVPEIERYVLGDEIARGGMGRVVEATDTRLGRTVAFKEALSDDSEALRRFERETRITARLEHPSIVPVHDAGTSPITGAPFYVMRKIGGRPLESLVGEANTLAQRLALIPHIVASAHAIAHAHERGIVHRDIKPSNILAGELGETIVIDWGLAKVIGEADELSQLGPGASLSLGKGDPLQTRAGVVFGTPGFMSPEQLMGAPVDEQCDVYALGATLYHLLARRPPHYAQTADEMMRNAITAMPTPVGELASGVPPELETIVAKALAQTAEARYPTSRALAEDLQRFLTGQLVAAHRYSRKERFWRFVNAHRMELGIAGVAVAVIAILSAGFIHRIIAERDRADDEAREARAAEQLAEEQKLAANERADQLTLSAARAEIGTNPTAAIASLVPLADSPRWWPQVRAIAAAARAAGVAQVWPASARTTSLELSHDGTRLLAVGADGVIRLHDLSARKSRTLAELHHTAMARFTGDDTRVVIVADTRVVIASTSGGAPRELAAPVHVSALAVSGATAYWTDLAGDAYTLDTSADAAVPQKLVAPEPLRLITPSPDGAWLALAGGTHMFMVDLAGDPDHKLVQMAEANVRSFEWSADSRQVSALLATDILVVATGEHPTIVERLSVGEQAAISMIRDVTYALGPTGVAAETRDGPMSRRQLAGYALGLHPGPNGVLVAASAQGSLAVMSEAGDPVLASPSGGLTTFSASPSSHYVAAAGDGTVLVWDLADVLPRRLTNTPPAAAELVDDGHVLATYPHRTAEWIDIAKSTSAEAGDLPSTSLIIPAPDGAHAAVGNLAHQLQVVAPGVPPVALEGGADRATWLSPTRLALATPGAIRVHDLAANTDATLSAPPGPSALASRGPWLAAAYADGSLWRSNGSGEARLSASEHAARAIALADDGAVLYASASELRVWPASGDPRLVATLPRPAHELHVIAGNRALALADTEAYAFDLATGQLVATFALAAPAAVAEDAGLVVMRTSTGVIEVVDPFAGAHGGVRWTLASSSDVVFGAPHISRDGQRVIASTPTGLVAWTLDLPDGPTATAAWLQGMVEPHR